MFFLIAPPGLGSKIFFYILVLGSKLKKALNSVVSQGSYEFDCFAVKACPVSTKSVHPLKLSLFF